MRLLQLVPVYDSYRVFLKDMAAALTAAGHEVLTVCDTENRLLPFPIDKDFPIQHLDFPRGAQPFHQLHAASRLRTIIRHWQPDVVHAHFSAAVLTAALARTLLRLQHAQASPKPRWLATFQGLQFPLASGVRAPLLRTAESRAASAMDAVYVLTPEDAASLRQSAPSARVLQQQSLGFGCRDTFHDSPPTPQAEVRRFRRTWGIPEEAVLFLFVGRRVHFKGFHLAARAFLQAHAQRPEFHWLVIGEDDPLHPSGLDDKEWALLRNHPAVHLAGPMEEVLPAYDAADALLFPSSREGMSVAIMEALARRLPVLTNRARGCRELIQHGHNGFLFPTPQCQDIRDQLLAFSPFQAPPPDKRTRRSAWVREMIEAYSPVSS